MKVTKEIYEAHRKLSNCSAKFLDFVKENPESLKRANFSQLNIDQDQIKPQSWPTFIDKKTRKEIEEASVKVCKLIKNIPRRLFSNNPRQVSQYYEISEYMARTMLSGVSEEHIDNLLGRGDFIFSSSGLKCLEFNMSANVGGWETSLWESLYMEVPIISKFFRQYNIKPKPANKNLLAILSTHLIRTALDKFPGPCNTVNVAITSQGKGAFDKADLYVNHLYKNILHQTNKKLNGKVIFCGYHELEIADNSVYYKGEPVHVLLELYDGAVPPDFVKAVNSGNVIIYNGHITGLLSNKFNLALLSENADSNFFTPGEKEVILKYIPWTRKIVPGETTYEGKIIDLEDFVRSHRARLVIKPSMGTGGVGVYVGQKLDETRWLETVKTAFQTKGWLVQEYVESSPYLYQLGENRCSPHDVVWGFFVIGSCYAGGWVRVLPKEGNPGVVNCSQGAEESSIFEINE